MQPTRPSRAEMRCAQPEGAQVAFVCPRCGRAHGDPLYTAPRRHSPAEMDFDCWVESWEGRMGEDWSRVTMALWLETIGGFTRAEVGRLLGVTARTVHRWVTWLRKNREKALELVSELSLCNVRRGQDE